MYVNLLFFAELRDLFGVSATELTLEPGATVSQAFDRWQIFSGRPVPFGLPLRFAVNEEYVEAGHILENGDRVALLTPVSGG